MMGIQFGRTVKSTERNGSLEFGVPARRGDDKQVPILHCYAVEQALSSTNHCAA